MKIQTFLLVTAGAAIKSRDVVKAHAKKTLVAMAAPMKAWGLLSFSSKAVLTSRLSSLPSISPGKTRSLGGGWCSERISPNTPGVHDSPLLPSHLRSQRTSLPNLQYSRSQLALEERNLASASLGNASAVKVGNLMSW